MHFTLTITLVTGAALTGDRLASALGDVAYSLEELTADDLRDVTSEHPIRAIDGTPIGSWRLSA